MLYRGNPLAVVSLLYQKLPKKRGAALNKNVVLSASLAGSTTQIIRKKYY